MAFDTGELHLQAPVRIRLRGRRSSVDNGAGEPAWARAGGLESGRRRCWSRPRWAGCCSTRRLPPGYRFVNYEIRKGQLSAIVNDLAERFPKVAAGGDAWTRSRRPASTGPPGPA